MMLQESDSMVSTILHIQDNLRLARQDGRSRSRSPHGDPKNDMEHKSPIRGNSTNSSRLDYTDHGSRKYHASNSRRYAPIYVIDVQSMYRRLMQTDGRGKDPPGKDVDSTARELGLSSSTPRWCAGNECGCVALHGKKIVFD